VIPPPFEETFKEISETISLLPLQDFHYTPKKEEYRRLDGNWKQHAWNYMDSLHIKWIHKKPNGLQDALDMESYRTELYPYASLQWAYAKNPASGFDPQYLPKRFRDPENPKRRVFALWFFVFPNLTLNFYPWGLSINLYMPVPDDPTKVDFYWYHFVWDNEKYQDRDSRWLNSQVDTEDVQAMQQIAKAAIRPKTEPGRRFLFGLPQEKGPHWFHWQVFRGVYRSTT